MSGVNPEDLHRLRPVLNLFFQQAIGLQTRELPERNPALKYQVMMLLDEFTALGRIPIIAEAISYLPGYNVRVVLVIQTPAQLREVYGIHNAEDNAEEPRGPDRLCAEGLCRCAGDLRRTRVYHGAGNHGIEAARDILRSARAAFPKSERE